MLLTANGRKSGGKDSAYTCRQHAKGGGVFKEIPEEHPCDIVVKAKYGDGCLYVCGSCPIQPVDLYSPETKAEVDAVLASGATYPDSYELYKNVPFFHKKARKSPSTEPTEASGSNTGGGDKMSTSSPIVASGKTHSSTTSKSAKKAKAPTSKNKRLAKKKQGKEAKLAKTPKRENVKGLGGKRATPDGHDGDAIDAVQGNKIQGTLYHDPPDIIFEDYLGLFDNEGEEYVRPMPKRPRGSVLSVQSSISPPVHVPKTAPARISEFTSVNQDSFNFIAEGLNYRSPVTVIADEDESRHSVESFTTTEQSCTPSPPRGQQARKHLNSTSSECSLDTELGGGFFTSSISLTSTMDQVAYLPLSRNVSSTATDDGEKILPVPLSRETSMATALDSLYRNEGPVNNPTDFGLSSGPSLVAMSEPPMETDEDISGESDIEISCLFSDVDDCDAEVMRFCNNGGVVPTPRFIG